MEPGEHHKEVYAHFGLAIYRAQVLEAGLINALTFFSFFEKHAGRIKTQIEWTEQIDAFESSQIAKPMGALKRALLQVTKVPDDLESQLTIALQHRNYLVHRYFQENIARFLDEEGRDMMIADFERYGEEFERADRMVEALVAPLYKKYRFTPEVQAEVRKEMEQEYLSRKQ